MKVDFELMNLLLKKKKELYFKDKEACVVILAGKCNVRFSNNIHWENIGMRDNVFQGAGCAIYVPCNMGVIIDAESDKLEFAVISTYAKHQYEPFIVKNDQVKAEVRGEKEWKRTVFDIISAEHKTESLIVGETYHTEGVWSGYPPHKHDKDNGNLESSNEEVYFVKVEPDTGFSLFLQYSDKDDKKSVVLHNDDTVYVKDGYHSIVSAAGHKFYYLWALSSKNKKFICSEDVDYSWLRGKA